MSNINSEWKLDLADIVWQKHPLIYDQRLVMGYNESVKYQSTKVSGSFFSGVGGANIKSIK